MTRATKSRPPTGLPSNKPRLADAAHELMMQIAEIGGAAHAVDRALYHADDDTNHDAIRLAVVGIRRLAESAADSARELEDALDQRGAR